MDCRFPVIIYDHRKTPLEHGREHGEAHGEAIRELARLRKEKLLELLPSGLHNRIGQIASRQWLRTEEFSPGLAEEMEGISEGAGLGRTDLVILNNFTDFRDMEGGDQGCSCVFAETESDLLAGQTWDMHKSAKDYICLIDIRDGDGRAQVVFSLVGCLGMAGFTAKGTVAGVNNLNTKGARAGVIWPAVVRELLGKGSTREMAGVLKACEVSSGRNYMIGSREEGAMWEVSPKHREEVGRHESGKPGVLLHTNHCLGRLVSREEIPSKVASTTRQRMELLARKSGAVRTFDDLRDLFGDHEGYPASICSHTESHPHDPSHTCGGGIGDLRSGKVTMWRGCREHDDNYIEREFDLSSAP